MGLNTKLVEKREQHASTDDAEAAENYVFGGTTAKSSAVTGTLAVRRLGKGVERIWGSARKRKFRRDRPAAERRHLNKRRQRSR
jgi:hypothetical protein